MSGGLLGGFIGAAIGFFVGGPTGALYGFSIGSAAGSLLLAPDQTQYGPRLEDLKAQSSQYGSPIPIVYGTIAVQGSVIWSADLIEVQTEESQGGSIGPKQTTVNYAYFGSFAVMVCEGPITRITRIWAGPGKRLIWDGVNLESGSMTVYNGTEEQEPDPLMEAAEGVGNVPAYRGACYVVFDHFALANDNNMLPFLTFEVGAGGGLTCPVAVSTVEVGFVTYSIFDPAPQKIADVTTDAAGVNERSFNDASTGFIYYVYQDSSNDWWINRVDPVSGGGGPPLYLFHAFSAKTAWSGAGTAAVLMDGQTAVTYVDLALWVVTGTEPALSGIICDSPSHCGIINLVAADVVWMGGDPWNFGFLAYYNSESGYPDILAIESVDTIMARVDLPYSAQWESGGARAGGELLQFPDGAGGGVASFITQPSNNAPTAITWSAFDSKREMLVSFSDGAYFVDGEYNTADFAIPLFLAGQAVYSRAQDMFYAIASDGIRMYDPEKLSPDGWPPEECLLYPNVPQAYANGEPIPYQFNPRLFIIPSEPDFLGVVTGSTGDIMKVRIARGGAGAGGVSLASVVADLSERAGEPRYNVDELEADTVDGYAIARQTQVRAAIAPLRTAYYFDAVESQGVIRFVKRGGDVAMVIDDADLAAREGGGEPPDPLNTTRRMEVELPRAVTVNYMLAATNYETASKQARRLIGSSGDEQTLDAPLVLSETKAQEVAEVNLHAAWVERLSYSFTLPRKYSHLEPTDLVLVKGHLMRLTSVKATPRGVLECAALADESAFYSPHVVVSETPPTGGTVGLPGVTRLEIF